MSLDTVRKYLQPLGYADRMMVLDASSATVPEAAKALGVKEQLIAKTLSFQVKEKVILLVAAGDARLDNHNYKHTFHAKAKMLPHDDTEALTGHPVGGVCPFANPDGVEVYLDESLKRFEIVYPACGSANSAIPFTPDELFEASGAVAWVDVCKIPETEE